MVLVDTSVWIDLLRNGNPALDAALAERRVLTHPFVIGELACGALREGRAVRDLVERLPRADEATHAEVLAMLDAKRLAGSGIGWVDAHLLASALVSRVELLTLDRALATAWSRISTAR